MDSLIRLIVGVVVLVSMYTPAVGETYVATATLITNPSQASGQAASYIVGTITFTQNRGESNVLVEGRLKLESGFDLKSTSIGFHVHQTSNFSNGCNSTGLHYNPENKTHGGPTDTVRHVGDLGNVVFDANTKESTVKITDNVITLTGSRTIVGRSLVLHFGIDDLGKGGNPESLITGNAGGRYACGPIVLASDFSPSSSAMSVFSGGRLVVISLVALVSIAGYGLRW